MNLNDASTAKDTDTISSLLQNFVGYDAINVDPSSSHTKIHPFAAHDANVPNPLTYLKDLESASLALSNSLSAYLTIPNLDQRLIGKLKEQSDNAYKLHAFEQSNRRRIQDLRARSRIAYGEDIPIQSNLLADWCISRLEQWGRSTGMEIFKEQEREERLTLVLGGKVLVVDVDIAISLMPIDTASVIVQASDSAQDSGRGKKVEVISVKISHAISSGTSLQEHSDPDVSLDSFLKNTLNDFFEHVQDPSSRTDTLEAARRARMIQSHFEYLMKLDRLASQEGDPGIRWFSDINTLNNVMNGLTVVEAKAVANALNTPSTPLDIYLLRGHAISLPYTLSPSIDFLAYISPLVYLNFLRQSQSKPLKRPQSQPSPFDIPIPLLRANLTRAETPPQGTVLAALRIAESKSSTIVQYHPDSSFDDMSMNLGLSSTTSRPTFPLQNLSSFANTDHAFPHVQLSTTLNLGPASSAEDEIPGLGPSTTTLHMNTTANSNIKSEARTDSAQAQDDMTWVLDFTNNGSTSGIVMSQSRMREVQLVVNPGSAMDDLMYPSSAGGFGSWVDFLLNPDMSPCEVYTATYTSPSNAHPPLRLRLHNPNEPGFYLAKVPVKTLKEVWGILEVVRDQSWLNETLRTLKWTPEIQGVESVGMEMGMGISMRLNKGMGLDLIPGAMDYGGEEDSTEATGDDLVSVLSGFSSPPWRIPVQIYIVNEQPLNNFNLYGDSQLDSLNLQGIRSGPPRFLMALQSQTQGLNSMNLSQLHISVTHDVSKERGLSVDVSGTLLPLTTEQTISLEEFARRGAVMGLAGRVWSWNLP